MRKNEWHDTSMARENPAALQSTTRPCRSSAGAKAIACSRKSNWPHSVRIRSKTASSWPGLSHIAGQQQLAAERVGDRADIGQRLVVQVGRPRLSRRHRQKRARSQRRCWICWRCRQPARACREGRLIEEGKSRSGMMLAPVSRPPGKPLVCVCRAIMASSSVAMTRTSMVLAGVLMHAAPGALAALVQAQAEPRQPRAHRGADRRRVFADAGGEDQPVQPAQRADQRAGLAWRCDR